MTLLAVGTVAFDTIETPEDSRERILGGSATYFSFAASYFSPVRLVGIVGKDWSECYSRLLTERGIDLSGLAHSTTQNTYFWHGKYTQDLQDRATLQWNTSGFEKIRPEVPPQFRDSKTVFLGAASPNIQLQTLEQCSHPSLVVADTVDAWIEGERDALEHLVTKVDCLLINDSEARQYTRQQNLIRAGRLLQGKGPSKVIIKKGEHGCLFFSDDEVIPCPAFPLETVVDPTGAGDRFAGGVLGFLSRQQSLDRTAWLQAIQMGTVLASFTVSGFSLEGLQRTKLESIHHRFEKFRRMWIPEN